MTLRPSRFQNANAAITAACLLFLANASAASGGEMSGAERAGREIYLHGKGTGPEPITVVFEKAGPTPIPATSFACANCHGRDGLGRPEGGAVPSNITWDSLTRPYEVSAPSGRKHGPYDERSLKRAFTLGLDSAGNRLGPEMPRYRMSQAEAANLNAYLKLLGQQSDPGLSADEVRLGVILPPPQSGIGGPLRSVVQAFFADVNEKGGVFNRRVAPRFLEAPAGMAERREAVQKFAVENEVFALIGLCNGRADEDSARWAAQAQIPVFEPFCADPSDDALANPWLFYLDSGLTGEGASLARFAARRPEIRGRRAAIVSSQGELPEKIAAAIAAECQASGWTNLQTELLGGHFNAGALAAKLEKSEVSAVFFLGSSAQQQAILREVEHENWKPVWLAVGSLAGGAADNAAGAKTFYFSYPGSFPADNPRAMERLRALSGSGAAAPAAMALGYLSTASVVVEALQRCGRDASRARLLDSLEGFYRFDSGFCAPLTFGRNRRVGAADAPIFQINPQKLGVVRMARDAKAKILTGEITN